MSASVSRDDLHDDQLLTAEQVAALTGVSVGTLLGWRTRNRRGGPPYHRLGPQLVRYRWGTVRDWIKATTVIPTE